MIKLKHTAVQIQNGVPVEMTGSTPDQVTAGLEKTLAYQIMRAHSVSGGSERELHIRFDALISHDITYVGIIQSARASGLTRFPLPYALTNCHNSLCAVGGTINEDDHIFGLSAAQKYGGIYVPANQAVIHQYARETLAGCGKMILGSDSHTRYGALGTMGVGEGGPELVKQLLKNTYDIAAPEVILVWLEGAPRRGVGPHDVAIALCGAVYSNGFVKNKVLEFAGPGVESLSMDYRIGIDVMTTETACLSSIWTTDDKVQDYALRHGRPGDYRKLELSEGACYSGMVTIDLDRIEPMIALPFHPSNAYPLRTFIENAGDLLRKVELDAERQFGDKVKLHLTDKVQKGRVSVDQGIIAGCAGGMYENIAEAAAILNGADVGNGYFSLSVYPPSVPVNLALIRDGIEQRLMEAGALFKPCFCGPCFGAGDVPGNGALSIRHTTRNFPNREGSKPSDGQLSCVALMDARSIAATALHGGVLTPATQIDYEKPEEKRYEYDHTVYEKRVYNGWGRPDAKVELRYGPNITDWPQIPKLKDNMLIELACVIHDPVTTTDELIPSGETSSYRSNPLRLAQFTLSRRDPGYVNRAKAIERAEAARAAGQIPEKYRAALEKLGDADALVKNTQIGSGIFATCPGDGSAREQAASCQRVLGASANLAVSYATKRYRSNLINWGIMPFTIDEGGRFDHEIGDLVFVPGIRQALMDGAERVQAKLVTNCGVQDIALNIQGLGAEDREILLAGCLMNYYADQNRGK